MVFLRKRPPGLLTLHHLLRWACHSSHAIHLKAFPGGSVPLSSTEDPAKILDQALMDMQGDLVKFRQAVAIVSSWKEVG